MSALRLQRNGIGHDHPEPHNEYDDDRTRRPSRSRRRLRRAQNRPPTDPPIPVRRRVLTRRLPVRPDGRPVPELEHPLHQRAGTGVIDSFGAANPDTAGEWFQFAVVEAATGAHTSATWLPAWTLTIPPLATIGVTLAMSAQGRGLPSPRAKTENSDSGSRFQTNPNAHLTTIGNSVIRGEYPNF